MSTGMLNLKVKKADLDSSKNYSIQIFVLWTKSKSQFFPRDRGYMFSIRARGMSKTISVLIIVVLILLVGIVGYTAGDMNVSFTTVTNTVTVTTITIPESQIIGLLFTSHLQKLSLRNVSEVVRDYEPYAVLVWEGNSQGLGGIYVGTENITILYDSFLGSSVNLSITNSTYSLVINSTSNVVSSAVVNSTISIVGYSMVFDNFTILASTKVDYAMDSGGTWLITNETWNFLQFYATGIHAFA